MRKSFYSILLFLLFASLHTHAIIIETNNLEDIYKHLDYASKKPQEVIIAFDIDDTIAQLPFGLAQWLAYKLSDLINVKKYSTKDALEIALPMWFVIAYNTDLHPLGNSPKIIRNLQDRGFITLGLTNRSIPIIKKTVEQLKDIGIHFGNNNLYNQDVDFSITHLGKFSNGILFTGQNDKGKALFLLLEKLHYTPKKIIFIDDQLKQVATVEKEVEKHGIEYVGIRFSLEDEHKMCPPNIIQKIFYEFKVNLGLEPL